MSRSRRLALPAGGLEGAAHPRYVGRMRRALLMIPFLALAACATPAERIASKLGEYGVPPREAQCMGDRLANRLSTAQLQRLNDLARTNGERVGRMTIGDIARLFSGPGDVQLASQLLRAGLSCAI